MRLHRALLPAVLLGGLLLAGVPAEATGETNVSVSFFHSQLAPHGRWVVAASLGNVWVPSGVAPGWAPYTDGEWQYTDYGWTWVSYDPWGDIPCHYGAWSWADPYGWVWTPGTVWAPAWVTWAYTDDYVGWAPLPPSFAFSAGGYAGAPIVIAQSRYVFVPTRRFVGVRVSSVRVPETQVVNIFPRANKVTNFQVASGIVRQAGPPRARIEKAVGRPIAPARVDQVKASPTTLAQAGFTKASRVSIAAPEAERSRVAPASESRTENRRSEKPAASAPAERPGSSKSEASDMRDKRALPNDPTNAREEHATGKREKPATNRPADSTATRSQASPKPEPPEKHARNEARPAPAPRDNQSPPQPEKHGAQADKQPPHPEKQVQQNSRPQPRPDAGAHPAPAPHAQPQKPAHAPPPQPDAKPDQP